MDDSDVLWEQHASRKFRAKKRYDMETWRDMFLVIKIHLLKIFIFFDCFLHFSDAPKNKRLD